jgi:hypothetical protein
MKTYTIPKYGITVEVVDENGASGGGIKSGLSETLMGSEPYEGDFEIDGAINALESLILGHACAGIDISSKAYVEGLDTAIEAIANNL